MSLFADITYFIVPSYSLARQAELTQALDINGATRSSTLLTASHIISNTDRFEGWRDVENGTIIVTDQWVDRCLILGKVQPPQLYSTDPGMIFSGVVACATELPRPDLEVLSAGISSLGGQWRTGLTRDVTHLFALSPTSDKYITALHHQPETRVKVLLPHWFDDSVRLGMRGLPTQQYEWPEPRLLAGITDEAKGGGKLGEEKRVLFKTALTEEPTAKSKEVWDGRRILLHSSLELSGGRLEAVEAGILRSKGSVVVCKPSGNEVDKIDDCDILVTRYRNGKAYKKAVRTKKTVGSLAWLFHCESTGVLSSPLDQLLHYPIPKKPIESFTAHEITVTNYTGESRDYIKKLITTMGATFTPSMSGRNTVLIAAFISGNKTTKALNWSIPIVNHTWLEDCFAQWRNLTVGLEKYIVFPPGVDFAKTLGERGVRGVENVDDIDSEGDEGEGVVANGDIRAPVGTEGSAMDAREVEGVVGMEVDVDNDLPGGRFDVDGDAMDVDESLKPQSTRKPASRSASKSMSPAKPTMGTPVKKPLSPRKAKDVAPAPSRSPSPTPEDDDADIEDPVVQPARKKLIRRSGTNMKLGFDLGLASHAEAKRSPKKSGEGKKQMMDEDEDEDMDAVEEGVQPKGREKAAKSTLGKARAVESDHEENNDGDDIIIIKSKTRSQGKKTMPVSEDEDEDEEIELEEKMVKPRPKPTPKGKQREEGKEKAVEVSRPKPRPKAKLKDKVVSEDEDEEKSKPSVQAKKRNTPKRVVTELSGPEIEEIEDVIAITAKGKGKEKVTEGSKAVKFKPKEQVKKQSISKRRAISESEDEEVEEAITSDAKGKGKEKIAEISKTGKSKPNVPARRQNASRRRETSDEEEDEETEEVVGPRKRKQQVDSGTEKRSRVRDKVIEKDGESEDDAEEEHEADIQLKSKSPRTKPSTRASEANQTRKESTGKVSKSQSIPKALVDIETDTEPDPDPTDVVVPSASKGKRKPDVPVTPAASGSVKRTPKRVVSVLVPPMTLKTMVRSSESPTASPIKPPARNESIRAVADEGPSTSNRGRVRPAATPKGVDKEKNKTKEKENTEDLTVRKSPASSSHVSTTLTTGRDVSKRGAASKAIQRLRDEIMPDANNYQLERKNDIRARKGGDRSMVSYDGAGGESKKKRHSDVISRGDAEEDKDEDKRDAKRRRVSTGKVTKPKETDDDSIVVGSSSKGKGKIKAKGSDEVVEVNNNSSKKISLMTTQVTLPDDVLKSLMKLGVKITTRPSECTHLLAPHLVRTEKFLCALAVSPFILSEKWATQSAAAKTILPVENFLLHDPDNERKYDFKLSDAIRRAKEVGGRLFAKKTFYVTPKVPIDFKLLKNVVAAGGGQVVSQTPTLRILNANSDRHVISCVEDISIWRPLALQHPIYTQELLLTSALKQALDWEDPAFKVPGSF